MSKIEVVSNDCQLCALRLDGTTRTYCAHDSFNPPRYTNEGRVIPNYPQTPKWCPGMVPLEDALPDGDPLLLALETEKVRA